MKKTLIQGIVCVSALMALGACSDSNEPNMLTGAGRISLAMEVDNSVLSSRSSRAEVSDVTTDDLSIRLTSADGSYSKEWSSVAEFDKEALFSVGQYTLEAFYGDEATEGFEAPYIYGKTNVKVEENQTATVALTAALANAMVSITYTDNFKDYMAKWGAEVHSAGGAYTYYAQDETRPVYVQAGEVEINLEITKPNGTEGKLRAASFMAQAKHHYHMQFDLNQGSGEAVLTIIFDETLEEENIEIELSDELMNAPAPEAVAEGFTSGEAVTFVPGMAPSESMKVNIIARGGIASVKMTTVSTSLLDQGWPAEIDLVGAPDNMRQRLAALGLSCRGLYTKPDKLAVIELNEVLSHITEAGDSHNDITFEVVDRYGKVSELVTLSAVTEPLALSLEKAGILYMGSSSMTLDFAYNGPNPEKNVTIEFANDRGTWTKAAFTCEKTGDGTYTASLTGLPNGTDAVKLRGRTGNITTAELTVEREPVTINVTASENNVFATHATLECSLEDAPADIDLGAILKSSDVIVSSAVRDGSVTATKSGENIILSGLTPGSQYSVKVKTGESEGNTASFNTENEIQLPNSDMENWTSTAHTSCMVEWYPGGDVWSTLNGLTISEWEKGKTIFGYLNYAYRASSGTLQTEGANGNGALIRTIAWGDGTTSAGAASTIKHVDRGELYLGSWNSSTSQPVYGIPFTSRPAALKFNYKFESYNNRNGYVEIIVKDADGKEIAKATQEITDKASYSEMSMPLSYSSNAAKAATLELVFRSSKETSLGSSDIDKVFNAGVGSSTAVHEGSKLYIDDIQLIY